VNVIDLLNSGIVIPARNTGLTETKTLERALGRPFGGLVTPHFMMEELGKRPCGSKGIIFAVEKILPGVSRDDIKAHFFIFTKTRAGVITFRDGQTGVGSRKLPEIWESYRIMDYP